MNTLPRRTRAFTLVELLIVTATIGIVLAIGIPGLHAFSGSNRITTATNVMVHHLHYARSEAIRLVSDVVLCPSSNGMHCLDQIEWQNGFILFADRNGNRIHEVEEPLLRYHRPGSNGVRILSTSGRKKLIYQASGMARGSTATITVCDRLAYALPRAIIISNPGRPRLSRTRANGSALACR